MEINFVSACIMLRQRTHNNHTVSKIETEIKKSNKEKLL